MTYKLPSPFAWNFCGTCGTQLVVTFDGQSDKPYCADCHRFFYLNPVPAACCFVSRAPGELLFARRAVEPCKGEWSLPGGFMELGESAEEAALRELMEETNLRASKAQLLGVNTQQSPTYGAVMVLGFIVDEWEGASEMRPDSDASELAFFPYAHWPSLAFGVHRALLARYAAHMGLSGAG